MSVGICWERGGGIQRTIGAAWGPNTVKSKNIDFPMVFNGFEGRLKKNALCQSTFFFQKGSWTLFWALFAAPKTWKKNRRGCGDGDREQEEHKIQFAHRMYLSCGGQLPSG